MSANRRKRIAAAWAVVAAALLLWAASAQAISPSPGWTLDSFAAPTNFSADQNARCDAHPEGENPPCDAYAVRATNAGSKATNTSTVTLTDTVPAGLSVKRVAFFWRGEGATAAGVGGNTDLAAGHCTTAPLQCHISAAEMATEIEGHLVNHPVLPDDILVMVIYVTVDEPAAPGPPINSATVAGGGAPSVSTTEQNAISPAPEPFGVHLFRSFLAGIDGQPDLRAGGHPYELATRIGLSTVFRQPPNVAAGAEADSTEDVRDVVVDLPPGVVGSTLAAPTCTQAQVLALGGTGCPQATVVGHLRTEPTGLLETNSPIYNMAPEHGRAAEFAYTDAIGGMHVIYAGLAPTPSGYVLRATSPEVPQIILTSISATLFGNPALKDGGGKQIAMLTNSASCDGRPQVTTIHVDSWRAPGAYNPDGTPDFSDPDWASATSQSPPVTGCDQLQFAPTISAKPTTAQGDSPSGLDLTIDVPQPTDPTTLATPPLKKAVITLPEGMTVNPSSANGLAACSLGQLGLSAAGVPDAAQPRCPDASKLGTVEVKTPALPGVLEGQIYLAKQGENPFGSLLALYIVVDDPTTGVVVKIPAEVKSDPTTGRLITVVDNSPQLPFSELSAHFFGGARAALRTPAVCGNYEVSSQLTPWSAPASGPPATPSAGFKISEGCVENASEAPNAPLFSAGTVTPTAALYSPFVARLKREDGSQELDGLRLSLPPGLIGKLAGVAECPDAALATAARKTGTEEVGSPSCPPGSEVGSVTVGAGAGSTPYYASGHAYLAGPYKGAPLSLAIVTPAVAGPFDLGTVVVRTALQVDPRTAQITAISDEIPHILQGIPLDARSIALQVDRPDFTLNPTNCEAMAITGVATSVLGQSAPLANRFRVGGCSALPFKPKFKLRLKGGTRRSGNPSLRAELRMPRRGANIARVQVGLPHSELLDQSNLKKVCTQPELQSKRCPASSIYGHAKAWTPLLDKPLEGPVYLGVGFGYKLPALVADLNGQIRILLVGKIDTDAQKGLRNTFEVVPDAPVSRFVLQMKGGPKYSLLENSENICRTTQRATVRFTAQSGKVLVLTPKILNSCKRKASGGRHKGHRGHKGH